MRQGKIIDSIGNKSDQTDIIVFHKKTVAPIFLNSQLGLFPVECVRYAFEVKSTISATEIKDANSKFRTLSKLKSYPKTDENGVVVGGPKPASVLLAFSSDIVGNELERYLKYTDDRTPPCTVLCVLGKGYWWHAQGKWRGIECTQNIPPFTEYAAFITGVMNTLSADECSIRPFCPGDYIDAVGVIMDAMKFKPEDTVPDFIS